MSLKKITKSLRRSDVMLAIAVLILSVGLLGYGISSWLVKIGGVVGVLGGALVLLGKKSI